MIENLYLDVFPWEHSIRNGGPSLDVASAIQDF